MKPQQIKNYSIDAAGESVGRLASRVATLVQGKRLAHFMPNTVQHIIVSIKNIDKMKISDKRLIEKVYYRSSGYPGGLKEIQWKKIYDRNPQMLFIKIIYCMLPSNKLRKEYIKMIKFE